MITRLGIYLAIGIGIYLTPSATMVDVMFRDDPEMGELFKLQLEDPDNLEVRAAMQNLRAARMEQEMQEYRLERDAAPEEE